MVNTSVQNDHSHPNLHLPPLPNHHLPPPLNIIFIFFFLIVILSPRTNLHLPPHSRRHCHLTIKTQEPLVFTEMVTVRKHFWSVCFKC